jgi:hypothetical protein
VPVPCAENGKHDARSTEQADYFGTLPGILRARKLQRERDLHYCWREEHEANQVKLRKRVAEDCFPGRFGNMIGYGDPDEEGKQYGSGWEIDVEAPTPGSILGYCTPDQ